MTKRMFVMVGAAGLQPPPLASIGTTAEQLPGIGASTMEFVGSMLARTSVKPKPIEMCPNTGGLIELPLHTPFTYRSAVAPAIACTTLSSEVVTLRDIAHAGIVGRNPSRTVAPDLTRSEGGGGIAPTISVTRSPFPGM